MNINEMTPAAVHGLWTELAEPVGKATFLEDASATLCRSLQDRLGESVVLSRVFLTVPFEALPPTQRAFAADLAEANGLTAVLQPQTPVLSLLASRGDEPAWNDRRTSRGHVAIPLLSEVFVESIPMLSRLLKELGLPLTWVHDAGAAAAKQSIGSETGLFHVAEASSAVDEQNRKIIAAEAFVAAHGVQTVFAVGGGYFGGSMLVLIVFCRQAVSHRTAKAFMPLVNFFKGATTPRFSLARVFHPEGTA